MTGEASAYAALGLEPGADAATVEQAYKRLIKEHHPDRSGGDALRAAEINRAYRELRAGRELRDPLELIDEDMPDVRRGSGWVAAALLASLVASGLMLTDSRLLPIPEGLASGKSQLALPQCPSRRCYGGAAESRRDRCFGQKRAPDRPDARRDVPRHRQQRLPP